MSIPLVQNNEKDSINTSIIAIKRNIERINMLLGLSNSEEIDTSKFATKEELQQTVTELQPVDEVTVDNMHSVTSNAVAKCLSYSTEEVFSGEYWLNNTKIYKKTFIFRNITLSSSSRVIGTHNIPIANITKTEATIVNFRDNNLVCSPGQTDVYLVATDIYGAQNLATLATGWDVYFTIFYVK